jgi:hypothetical protein
MYSDLSVLDRVVYEFAAEFRGIDLVTARVEIGTQLLQVRRALGRIHVQSPQLLAQAREFNLIAAGRPAANTHALS